MSYQPGTGQPPNQSGWGAPPPPDQSPGWGAPPSQPPGWGTPPSQPPGWGTPPPPAGGPTKYCPSCGAVIDAWAATCPRCGARQPDAAYEEPKNRPIAILLALLLGGFGIHRFYVGPVAWGIAYLIFFWTGVPGFLAWLEAIYWLTRSDVEWATKYGGPVRASNGCAIGCLWALALLPLLGIVAFVAMLLLAIPFTIA